MVEWIQMEEALDESDVRLFSRGDTVRGRVVQEAGQDILVDIGYKSEAVLPKRELAPHHETAQPGEEIDVLITYIDEENGTVFISERQAYLSRRYGELERAYKTGASVSGVILDEVGEAGYNVSLGGIRAFLPASHLGKGISTKIERLKGKDLEFRIIEFSRRNRNIVVSRREFLKELEEKERDALFAALTPGTVVEGTVKSVVDFGVFVDVGGHDGLVHRTEICWKDVPVPPPDKFEPGQKVKVMILEADREEGRISLSMKRLRPDPWQGIAQRYPQKARVKGKVVSVTDFGAFVELEEDVEGLVHISELAWTTPKHPKDVVAEGDEVEVVILSVDESRKRISLSLRRALPDPWDDVGHRYPRGALVEGKVTNVTDFGAFVELEQGVEGLIHISEISWQRVGHPKEVLETGQKVRAIVLKVDEEERRISLSLRALQQDPWEEFLEQYSVGSIVSGPITQIKDFGAFVRITPAVEGLIHVSEISPDRIASPSEALRLGQEVSAKIIGINESKRQVRLSIKKIAEDVEDTEKDRFLTPQAGRETFTLRERLKGLTDEGGEQAR